MTRYFSTHKFALYVAFLVASGLAYLHLEWLAPGGDLLTLVSLAVVFGISVMVSLERGWEVERRGGKAVAWWTYGWLVGTPMLLIVLIIAISMRSFHLDDWTRMTLAPWCFMFFMSFLMGVLNGRMDVDMAGMSGVGAMIAYEDTAWQDFGPFMVFVGVFWLLRLSGDILGPGWFVRVLFGRWWRSQYQGDPPLLLSVSGWVTEGGLSFHARGSNESLIKNFGGMQSDPDLDIGGLLSVSHKMNRTPGELEKLKVLVTEVVTRHVFVDGNKRTALKLAHEFLVEKGLVWTLSPQERKALVLRLASGDDVQASEWGRLRGNGVCDMISESPEMVSVYKELARPER